MNNPRAAYVSQSVNTASPARLLVMLYDRLVLDINRALECQDAGDHVQASGHLLHAQEIVLELSSTLRLDVWEGAETLSSLYGWLHSQLVSANTGRDRNTAAGCLQVVQPLAEAWREAALTAAVAG
jgi:flagellar protein FliS